MWAFTVNALIGFVVLTTFLFALPDVAATFDFALNPSGYAFIYVLKNASYNGGIVLYVLIQMVILTGSIDANASTARQTFAFARDHGLPFGGWVAKVSRVSHAIVLVAEMFLTCGF